MEFMERLVALVPRPRIHLTRYHGVLGPHYKYRKLIVPAPPPQALEDLAPKVALGNTKKTPEKKRISWARLLKRVFDIDISVCPKCRGKTKIIAAIEDPLVIKIILNHLELPSTPPKLHPARGPPEADQYDFAQEFFEDYPQLDQ